MMAAGFAIAACSNESPTVVDELPRGTLSISVDNSNGTALSLAPKSATLMVGYGTILKAQIADANGAAIAGAKATWRSTNTAVAVARTLPDSGLAIDNNRAAVAAISAGTAMIIASYENFADTATITVVPRTDTAPATQRPPRPTKFDLTVRVLGAQAIAGNPADSASRPPLVLLPGSKVTVTLLPPRAGDTTTVGTTPVTSPTLAGTATTDASGTVKFTGLSIARFRIDVTPPAGSAWTATSLESGAPYWGTIYQDIWLRKP
jgi:hypothetical protein